MLAWIIIIIVLLLILAFPIGVDAAYDGDERYLKLKLGLFRKTLFPKKKQIKTNKKKRKKKEKTPEQKEKEKEKRDKLHLIPEDILTLAEIGLKAWRRFLTCLSVDRLKLHWTAAASDPYDAVQQYGRVNAVLGILLGRANRRLTIREEDVRTSLDLEAERPDIRTRLTITIQIWEILLIGICAAFAGLKWFVKKKRKWRAANTVRNERSILDGEL